MARSRTAAIAVLLTTVLALAGCSSDSSSTPDTRTGASEGNRNNDGAPPANRETGRSNGSDSLCKDPELAGSGKVDAFCNKMPDTKTVDLKKINERNNGKIPTSNDYGGRVNVQGFLQSVMKTQRDDWRRYFEGSTFDVPDFAADIVSGREKHRSKCPEGPLANGSFITVTATSPHGLFCRIGDKDDGSIALPADTIAKLWETHDRETANMAAVIIASRAGGYQLNWELVRQNAGGSLNPMAASCLAGVWAHGVYAVNHADDLDRALKFAQDIPIKIGGGDAEPSTDNADRAWQIGYSDGSVYACSDPATWLLDGLN